MTEMTEIVLSHKARSLKIGTYKHYKGKGYQIIGVAIHSETLAELVVYRALYGKKLIWTRPSDMFLENVLIDGKKIPRFKYTHK